MRWATLVMAAVFAAALFAARPAGAEEILHLKPWPFGETEAVVLNLPRLKDRIEMYKSRSMRGLWGGYLDLDLDGVDELIVMEGYIFCGTSGCWAHAYKKKNGEWNYLTFLYGDRGRNRDQPKIRYSPELIGQYRALIGWDRIFIWNGFAYFAVCLDDHCRN